MKKLIYFLLLLVLSDAAIAQIPTPTWQHQGPTLFPVNGSGQINGIGRVTKIKFDPVNPHKLYATSASGGLWISRNDGDSWVGTGTDKMPYHKEATVCIDYLDTNIIYLGTGDPNYYSPGYGVWKSTDGGANFYMSNSGMGNRLVDELLMSPLNDSVLIAVTDSGIYKSYDAGATWVNKMLTGQFADMDFKPGSNGRVIYACTMDSFYRSDDAGETWNLVTSGFYIPGGMGGMGMRTAVTPADTNIVYIAMVANNGSIFKSDDGGHSLTLVKDSIAYSLTGYGTTDGGQGNYNFDFNIDPIDTNTVYLVSQNNWKSTLGGVSYSWQLITNWYEIVHTDMHHLTFNPHFPNYIYNANDGAVWLSKDSEATWTEKSDGLDGTEIAPEASSKLDLKTISIGTQDNGELYYDSLWITNRGGDWYEGMAYDYTDPQTVYYANGNRRVVTAGDQSMGLPFVNDYGQIVFSQADYNVAFIGKDTTVRTSSLSSSTPVWDIIAIFSGFVQAMALSPVDSNKLFIITNDDSLHICSNAMSANPVFTSYATPGSTYGNAGILVIDNQPNVLYMYNGGDIYTSADTGITWRLIDYNYNNSLDIVGMVHDKYTNDQSVFIANSNDVYYKNDTMTTWQNYSHGLPTVAQIQGLDMFNNGSPYSVLRVPFYGRGLWEAPINTHKTIAANFAADQKYICTGDPVHFYDSTYNHPAAWSWSFPGGTPATSAAQNPVVVYNSPGIYPVTLTASNGAGQDTKTQAAYINVRTVYIDSMPVSEGFEGPVFPPAGWTNYDGGGDTVVWQLANYGAHGTSAHSMFFDNYDYNETGVQKSMQFGTDLRLYDSVYMTFDVAYQVLQSFSDSLEVTISDNCAESFQRVYVKGGATLATAPPLDTPSAPFYPTAAQWRNDTVYLNAYSLKPSILISFNNISGYGTDIYVDNINLHGVRIIDTTAGIVPVISDENQNISIYPNPSRGQLNIYWDNLGSDKLDLTINNVLGEKVKELHTNVANQGLMTMDVSRLADGIYYVAANAGKTIKLVLMK